MSRSASATDSATDPKKRYVCPDCDKAFSTSSHLGRHSRVHTGEKNYKCSFPGCETRCSRPDNLQAHYRIHLAPQTRPKATKKSGAGRSAPNTSPVSSSSSSSPTSHYQASPPEMFRTPASRFSSVSATNSPRPLMSPQLSPSSTPRGPPHPLYDGFSEQFNTFASIQNPSVPRHHYPRPGGMPPPIVPGSPDDALEGFRSSMLLQNAAPLQRRSDMYPPHPSAPPRGPPTYPYATYPQASMSQYPTYARSPRGTPSPTPSDFLELNQLPRY
ncbi:hypothetical protein DFH09DRAFT_266701 [Mycena vulgaris]|nr:hypothetical protein DFH09DRAFT_266701 [Mycena vulgaris]